MTQPSQTQSSTIVSMTVAVAHSERQLWVHTLRIISCIATLCTLVHWNYEYNIFLFLTDIIYAVVIEVGTKLNLSCIALANDVTITKWTTGGSNITSAHGNRVILLLDPVNDRHHNEEYVCLNFNSTGSLVYQQHVTIIVHGKETKTLLFSNDSYPW